MATMLKTIISALVIFLLVRAALQNFVIQGPSMEPNLHNGELTLVEKLSYRLHEPRRGDIVVFHSPNENEKFIIKRVVGLPGETVEIRDGRPYICPATALSRRCFTLDETYVNPRRGEYDEPVAVAPDHYYVMGDNRAHSTDSRVFGPIARDAIVGRAWLSLWPLQEWGFAPNYSWANQP